MVEDDLLPQCLRHPLSDPPVLLAPDQQRVDDPTAVVDGDVPHRPDRPGLDIDLHDRDVRPEREGWALYFEVDGRR